MNYYCVACKTGGETKVRAHLNKYFVREHGGDHDVNVYFPVRKMFERRKGRRLVTNQPVLPGYLMLSTEQSLDNTFHDIRRIPGSYGYLKNLNNSIALFGSDMEYAAWIMGNKGTIKASKAIYRKGEPIKVIDGPLQNLCGTIVRVDRRGFRVTVEFNFANVIRRVSLPVEFIDADEVPSDVPPA